MGNSHSDHASLQKRDVDWQSTGNNQLLNMPRVLLGGDEADNDEDINSTADDVEEEGNENENEEEKDSISAPTNTAVAAISSSSIVAVVAAPVLPESAHLLPYRLWLVVVVVVLKRRKKQCFKSDPLNRTKH